MESIKINRNDWMYKYLITQHSLFGIFEIDYIVPEYDIRDTCSMRKEFIKKVLVSTFGILFVISACVFTMSVILSMIIIPLVYLFGNFECLPDSVAGAGSAGYVSVVMFASLFGYYKAQEKIREWQYSRLHSKEKEPVKPNIIFELYKSLKDKVCKKIEYID